MSEDILTMEFTAIEYDPSIYSTASVDGGSMHAAGAGSGLGNPEGNPNPISDAESGFDPETYTDLTDGTGITFEDGTVSGNAIVDDSLNGGKITAGTIDFDRLAFGLPVSDAVSLNKHYAGPRPSAGGSADVPIIGPSADDYSRIKFYAPTSGIYTFEFTFVQPFGSQDYTFGKDDSFHYHETESGVPGTYTSTENLTSNISPNGNIVYTAEALTSYSWKPSGVTNKFTYVQSSIRSSVDMEYYPETGLASPKSQTFSIRTYGSSGSPVVLKFSLYLIGGTYADCVDWTGTFYNTGYPVAPTSWRLPANNGIGNNALYSTDIAESPFYDLDPNVYVVAPTFTMSSSGNITLV